MRALTGDVLYVGHFSKQTKLVTLKELQVSECIKVNTIDEQDLKNSLCSLKNEISIKVTLNRATILFLAQAYKTTAITDITVCSAISLVEQSLTGL